MLAELTDLITLLATLPNRAVVLTEAAFLIVTFLFVLELSAPLFVLAGLIFRASALPQSRLGAGRALAGPRGTRRATSRTAAAATPVRPVLDESTRLLNPSSPGDSPSDLGSITELSRVISETQTSAGAGQQP